MLVAVGQRRGGGGDGAGVVELGGSCWSRGPAMSPCADAECLLDALNDGFGFFQVYATRLMMVTLPIGGRLN